MFHNFDVPFLETLSKARHRGHGHPYRGRPTRRRRGQRTSPILDADTRPKHHRSIQSRCCNNLCNARIRLVVTKSSFGAAGFRFCVEADEASFPRVALLGGGDDASWWWRRGCVLVAAGGRAWDWRGRAGLQKLSRRACVSPGGGRRRGGREVREEGDDESDSLGKFA